MKHRKASFFFIVSGFFAVASMPYSLASDFQSPRTLSLGGAGHAGPLLNDQIYLNPGFISLSQGESFAASYLYLKGPNDTHGRNYNLSLRDSHTELFQAGVGYTVREDGAFLHLGVSKSFFERVGFGLASKFFFDPNHTSARDVTFGVAAAPTEMVQLSFVADNLIETDAGKGHNLYREFILAGKANVMKIMLLYLDPSFAPSAPDSRKFGQEMGLEFTIMNDLFWRIGMFRNSSIPQQRGFRGNGFGTGIGWVTPRMVLDYAFSKTTSTAPGLPLLSTHSVGTSVFF